MPLAALMSVPFAPLCLKGRDVVYLSPALCVCWCLFVVFITLQKLNLVIKNHNNAVISFRPVGSVCEVHQLYTLYCSFRSSYSFTFVPLWQQQGSGQWHEVFILFFFFKSFLCKGIKHSVSWCCRKIINNSALSCNTTSCCWVFYSSHPTAV